ncbi:nucleotidyltransferase family protein [Paenibacillus sp. GCM10012307]|uniref:Nucleotidyltransferase family protein n=1 Tax=Paenibacillus roseus TaxID=2798579 RepID=A0A934MQJ5_9BACL|nr:nucleotidyltransferase family protein [Paenibacillus roseus]MBJ6363221.1 nucleotidyltransferase family protein [Paenibacillus roseus]
MKQNSEDHEWSILSSEQRLMVLASRIHLNREHEEQICSILEDGIAIDYFMALCIKHKVLPLVTPHLIRLDSNKAIKLEYKKVMNHAYHGNRMKNELMAKELRMVLNKANESGLKIIPLKGAWLIPNIYKDAGLRISNDLDFLISLDQGQAVSGMLQAMGYTPGHYDWASDSIAFVSEEEVIQWKDRSGNLHPHMKRVDNGFSKYIGVDFSYDVDLTRNFIASNGLQERAIQSKLYDAPAVCLNTVDFLIHLAIHLFKEASHERWVKIDQDINLIKFCDVREYILAHLEQLDWSELAKRSRELAAEEAIYYSLYYLKMIFNDPFVEMIQDHLSISGQEVLRHYVTSEGGQEKTWKKSFFERFFSLSNKDELVSDKMELTAANQGGAV